MRSWGHKGNYEEDATSAFKELTDEGDLHKQRVEIGYDKCLMSTK